MTTGHSQVGWRTPTQGVGCEAGHSPATKGAGDKWLRGPEAGCAAVHELPLRSKWPPTVLLSARRKRSRQLIPACSDERLERLLPRLCLAPSSLSRSLSPSDTTLWPSEAARHLRKQRRRSQRSHARATRSQLGRSQRSELDEATCMCKSARHSANPDSLRGSFCVSVP